MNTTQQTTGPDFDLIRTWVDKVASSKRDTRIGLPVSELPFAMAPAMHALLASGELEMVQGGRTGAISYLRRP